MDKNAMNEDIEKEKEARSTPQSIDTATLTCDNLSSNIADCSRITSKEQSTMSNGFIKLSRSDKVIKLIEEYPMAFALLSIIALRATRFDCAITGLKAGEAKITSLDLVSRQIYRSALLKLQELHFVTIRTTNRFTVAKLCNSDIYDINNNLDNQQSNQQATNKQPTEPSTRIDNKKKRNKEVNTVAPLLKLKFGLHVCLTEQEYKTYEAEYGKEMIDTMIAKLDDHFENGGKMRKNHARCLSKLNWVYDWYMKRITTSSKPQPIQDKALDNQIWASQFNRDADGWSIAAQADAWRASSWYDSTKSIWLGYKTQGFKAQVESFLRKHSLWTEPVCEAKAQ